MGRDFPRHVQYIMQILFQPTRPHGARHYDITDKETAHNVSTHAPAWGATDIGLPDIDPDEVSTHAPAWGATYCQDRTPRTGSVSTHAPAWGAT